jgi:hypothetical protein
MQFWRLTHSESVARLAEWVDAEMDLEQVTCPIREGHRRGGKRTTGLSVTLRGKGVEDFVWTWHGECMIQDHVLDLFRRSGFTGFDVKPAKARFKSPAAQSPPRLWEVVVTGWAGMASMESGITLVEHCPGCGHLNYSPCRNPASLIDRSKWDGSDFFMVWPMPGFILVTDRVAQTIHGSRLRGAVLKRVEDLHFSDDYGFSPGRLSHWMPADRASALGAALGID